MKRRFVPVSAACVLAFLSVPATGVEELLPPAPAALGMLTTFVNSARAYQEECVHHLPKEDVSRTLGSWFERNGPLASQVSDAGRKMLWFSVGPNDPLRWDAMQEWEFIKIKSQISEQLKDDPRLGCLDALQRFKSGTYELRNFPVHLRVLGIALLP